MKFSQYPYKRINIESFQKDTEEMINEFTSAESYKQQIQIIQKYQEIQKEIQTIGYNLKNAYKTKHRP